MFTSKRISATLMELAHIRKKTTQPDQYSSVNALPSEVADLFKQYLNQPNRVFYIKSNQRVVTSHMGCSYTSYQIYTKYSRKFSGIRAEHYNLLIDY